MAETVEFVSNGGTASGYLVRPEGGRGPGILVVQEWWGLNPGIKEMADRLAEGGFTALVPDLYHGELAAHDEVDKAATLMTTLPADRAARDMSGAIDFLVHDDGATGEKVGVVGFCMGGMLSLIIAANRGDVVSAAVPFYGFPQGDAEPDWSGLTAVVRGHRPRTTTSSPRRRRGRSNRSCGRSARTWPSPSTREPVTPSWAPPMRSAPSTPNSRPRSGPACSNSCTNSSAERADNRPAV